MSWLPEDTRHLDDHASVTCLRSQHGHEGGHDLTIGDDTLRVLPSSRHHTTARKRLRVLEHAYGAAQGVDGVDTVAYVVGSLLIAGATNILVNGTPIVAVDDSAGEWRLELVHAGQVRATYVGGSGE